MRGISSSARRMACWAGLGVGTGARSTIRWFEELAFGREGDVPYASQGMHLAFWRGVTVEPNF